MKEIPNRPLADFIHAHAGRCAVVMGGGVSLPEQCARAPADALWISANQHGCLLRQCDYIVALDDLSKDEIELPDGRVIDIRGFGVPIVSVRRSLADIKIFERPEASSGVTAAWVAWVMGCAPILLAGMDCYVGGTYFHDPKAQSTGRNIPQAQHLARWGAILKHCPDAMVRSLGGPLLGLFPAYDSSEPVKYPAKRAAIPGTAGTPARIVRPWRVQRTNFKPGQVVHLAPGELRRGLEERAVEKVAA